MMRKAKLGQHFLVNRSIVEKMAHKFLPVEGPILEIGPGKGILTQYLLNSCPGSKITAVELDNTLFCELKNRFSESIDILNRDVLHVDLYELFPGEDEGVNVIGNVPYYISKELMDWVIAHHKKIKKGMFMMQKEFANKFISPINAQSILFGWLFQVEKLFDVQPGSFSPQPGVKSSVFLFERIISPMEKDIDAMDFYRFLKQCFRNRRKTLFNNLGTSYDTKTLGAIFEKLRINPKVRAEQLTLKDFLGMYRNYNFSHQDTKAQRNTKGFYFKDKKM
jgi:16S rRNA (adenine1518-N6/adenine1519-N6)-dimethyltransferase